MPKTLVGTSPRRRDAARRRHPRSVRQGSFWTASN